jgi:pyridoxine/pyridoxamine 5'-phosphate oxidase
MIDLRDVRTQLLVVVGVLLLVSLGAIGLLLSPAGRSRNAREQEYERLRMEKTEKTRAATPVQGMDKKIEAAREEETQFSRERLAQRYSAMSEQLSHIASEAGVNVSTVKYDEHREKGTPPGFDGVRIIIQVRGTYAQDMRFINAAERQKMMLLVDAVSFGGMQGDTLTVSVHLSTFLRSAA